MERLPGVAEAAKRISTGELTCEALVQQCVQSIRAAEETIGAWEFVDTDAALDLARRKDGETVRGPLHGIPFGLKDIIDVAGWPTTYGSPIYRDYISPRDAACVALLKEAGAICLGKTVSTELGHVSPGKTRNPHDLQRTPGGSSSGSAAAVAAGMVPFALGTQTTGSVLRPASFCGVVGYKPTYGDVVNSGILPNSPSFDTVGVLCQEIDDLPLVRSALLRSPSHAQADIPLNQLRIGFLRTTDWSKAEASTQLLIEDAAGVLARHGAQVSDVVLPAEFGGALTAHRQISGYEFSRTLSWERLEHSDQLSPALVNGRLHDGLSLAVEQYHAAMDVMALLRHRFITIMADYDVLITPAACGEAPVGLASTGDPIFNVIISALHVPALSLPLFTGPNGLPVGLQLVGQWRDDERLFAIARTVRRALQ